MNERLIRKYQNTLMVAGRGIVLLGLWNIAKVFVFFLGGSDFFLRLEISQELYQEITKMEGGYKIVNVVFTCIMLLVLTVDLIFRIVIAKSAAAEANGQDKSCAYIVIAIIMLCIMCSGDTALAIEAKEGLMKVEYIISTVVEFTSVYALCDLINAAIRLRLLRKKCSEAENAG